MLFVSGRGAVSNGLSLLGCFYTGHCFATAWHGAVNWIQLISSGILTQAGGSLAARAKLGPWANLRCHCRVHFGTNPPAGETVLCAKAPFRPLTTVLLPLTNSALCKKVKRQQRCEAAQRCSKTAPCVKVALKGAFTQDTVSSAVGLVPKRAQRQQLRRKFAACRCKDACWNQLVTINGTARQCSAVPKEGPV